MAKSEKREMPALITQSRAAQMLGKSRPTVVAMVARGELEGETVAGTLFIHRDDAERLAAMKRAAFSCSWSWARAGSASRAAWAWSV